VYMFAVIRYTNTVFIVLSLSLLSVCPCGANKVVYIGQLHDTIGIIALNITIIGYSKLSDYVLRLFSYYRGKSRNSFQTVHYIFVNKFVQNHYVNPSA